MLIKGCQKKKLINFISERYISDKRILIYCMVSRCFWEGDRRVSGLFGELENVEAEDCRWRQ